MGAFNVEYQASTQLSYSLPRVTYSSSSLVLSSAGELVDRAYPGPFYNYLVNEAPERRLLAVPSAKEMTSLTYLGERRSHPHLRMKIYDIMQYRA